MGCNLNRLVRKNLSERTFEQKLEVTGGYEPQKYLKKGNRGRGNGKCQDSERGSCLPFKQSQDVGSGTYRMRMRVLGDKVRDLIADQTT